MKALIKKVEASYLKTDLPKIEIGDTVRVGIKIIEGKKERIQYFDGIVISIKGVGLNKNITVRKISFGIGVEKTIPLHSPKCVSVKVEKQGKVRRAKLYYLRGRIGKAATRIKARVSTTEKSNKKIKKT